MGTDCSCIQIFPNYEIIFDFFYFFAFVNAYCTHICGPCGENDKCTWNFGDIYLQLPVCYFGDTRCACVRLLSIRRWYKTATRQRSHMYVPTLMYLYVVRINYTNLDIRIQHTLTYQTGLCHTNTPLTRCNLRWWICYHTRLYINTCIHILI